MKNQSKINKNKLVNQKDKNLQYNNNKILSSLKGSKKTNLLGIQLIMTVRVRLERKVNRKKYLNHHIMDQSQQKPLNIFNREQIQILQIIRVLLIMENLN